MIREDRPPTTAEQAEAAARAAVPLLVAGGLRAAWVCEDIVQVTDGRGVCVQVRVLRLRGVVEAVWRVLGRVAL